MTVLAWICRILILGIIANVIWMCGIGLFSNLFSVEFWKKHRTLPAGDRSVNILIGCMLAFVLAVACLFMWALICYIWRLPYATGLEWMRISA